jgi:thiol-disulfide isomerase/thioredoxin
MRRCLAVIAVTALCTVSRALPAASADLQLGAAEQGKPLTMKFKSLEGESVDLSKLQGKVVLIDFWATWCGPCKASFPYLQKVYAKFKDNAKVVFLAVDTWERLKDVPSTVDNAKKFIADNKYTFPVLIDEIANKRVSEKYEVEGIPTKFLIDKKGNVAFRSVGFSGPQMEDELTAEINLLLGETL